MTVKRRKYTEEFKREAVHLMVTSGKPVAQRARDLGINDNNLYRWRGLYGNQAPARPAGRADFARHGSEPDSGSSRPANPSACLSGTTAK
jgi:transposase-like protein